jgi:hypothetical protein
MSLESDFLYGHHPASEAEDIPMTPEEELSLLVERQANYAGNWTELLRERMLSPFTRQKFLDMKKKFGTEEVRKQDEPLSRLEKHVDVPTDVFEHTQDNYSENIEKIFSETKYHPSKDSAKLPQGLGVSTGYGDPGAVFTDAMWDNQKLTDRQKTIIEAHEKLHGLMWHLTKAEKAFILSPFDLQHIAAKHKFKADEVLARMSQLKNYFGFKGNEVFTIEHLRYAGKHYVPNTGLDNNISNLFYSIDDVRLFLEVINSVVC